MATIAISKVSGVIIVAKTGQGPRYYYAPDGKFYTNTLATGYVIKIDVDEYQCNTADLRVNGQAPANNENGLVLLNAVFAT